MTELEPSPQPVHARRRLRPWHKIIFVLGLFCALGWYIWLHSGVFFVQEGKNGIRNLGRDKPPPWLKKWVTSPKIDKLMPVHLIEFHRQLGDADEGLRLLYYQPSVTQVNYNTYEGGPGQSAETFSLLASCFPNLKQLKLNYIRLTAHDCRALAKMPKLTNIVLLCEVELGAFHELAASASLETLTFVVRTSQPAALRELAELPIENLTLVTDEPGLALILNADAPENPLFPKLKHLKLGHWAFNPEESLDQLARLPQLEHLDLSESRLTDANLKRLEPLTRLHTLYLAHCHITDEGCASLAKLTSLRSLHLGATGISMKGVGELKPLKRLKVLSLHQCIKIMNDRTATLPPDFPPCRVRWK